MPRIQYETNCSSVNLTEWEELMEGAEDTDGEELRKMIKRDIPDLYDELALEFYNPYEHQSQKTETHYIYVHSAIEYFLRIIGE